MGEEKEKEYALINGKWVVILQKDILGIPVKMRPYTEEEKKQAIEEYYKWVQWCKEVGLETHSSLPQFMTEKEVKELQKKFDKLWER